MQLLKDLNWRYATKNMNGETIPKEALDTILEAIRLTATSYGLQPFKVIVVKDSETKQKLMAASYGQAQVGSASEVLVFAVPDKVTQADVDSYMQLTADTRSIPLNALDGLKTMIENTTLQLPEKEMQTWSAKQAYIALGSALIAAASLKIDACPMEGFDAAQYNEILGLKAQNLNSVVIMPIGYRSPEDATAHYKKVRKSKENLFIEI